MLVTCPVPDHTLPGLQLPYVDGSLISVSNHRPCSWAPGHSFQWPHRGLMGTSHSASPNLPYLHMPIRPHSNISEIRTYLKICGMAGWFPPHGTCCVQKMVSASHMWKRINPLGLKTIIYTKNSSYYIVFPMHH